MRISTWLQWWCAALLIVTFVTFAQEIPGLHPDTKALCSFKADVAGAAYKYRDEYPLDTILQLMKREWDKQKRDSWPYAAHVDSERIIREAYRKQAGKYKYPCCTEEIVYQQGMKEARSCVMWGF